LAATNTKNNLYQKEEKKKGRFGVETQTKKAEGKDAFESKKNRRKHPIQGTRRGVGFERGPQKNKKGGLGKRTTPIKEKTQKFGA